MQKKNDRQQSMDLQLTPKESPRFGDLLRKPLLKSPLPADFDPKEEAEHLTELWKSVPRLQIYEFETFIHAGGSGMVFKARNTGTDIIQALKIARKKLCGSDNLPVDAAKSLSPVSERELRALKTLSHPNVVRLYEAIESEIGVIAISTDYVEEPQSLDEYLVSTLSKDPDPDGKKGIHAFSPRRLVLRS